MSSVAQFQRVTFQLLVGFLDRRVEAVQNFIVDGHRHQLVIFSLLLGPFVTHPILNCLADGVVHHMDSLGLLLEDILVFDLVVADQAFVPLRTEPALD